MQKPLTGTILGILIGFGVAIFMARSGIWPADQLTMALLPGLLGLLGLLLLSMGRKSKGPATLAIALLLVVPLVLWGAIGFGSLNETGQLNGGCTVTATSASDSTTVTDTSRQDPFVIDPAGGMSWSATSPTAFMNYDWKLQVYVMGLPIPIDSGTESNEDGDTENTGDVSNVGEYADSRGIDLGLYQGIYKVGGSAATCNGFGFVEILGDGTDLIGLIALIVAITLLVILLVLTFYGRNKGVETVGEDGSPSTDGPTASGDDLDAGPAGAIAGGALDHYSVESPDKANESNIDEIQAAQDPRTEDD